MGLYTRLRAGVVRGLILGVRAYQHLFHGLMGYGACRYTPTCSCYMIEALRVHGPVKGLALGCWRILRCNPLSRGGYDPVPPIKKDESFVSTLDCNRREKTHEQK